LYITFDNYLEIPRTSDRARSQGKYTVAYYTFPLCTLNYTL
jgi:hypothetical protein